MRQTTAEQHSTEQNAPTYGIITAKTEEQVAVEILLNNTRSDPGYPYMLGDVPGLNSSRHRLAVARTLTQGTNSATGEATSLLHRFPSIHTLIMVGIAGGIPNPTKPADHIRLGDVVVSGEYGVEHYGMVREELTGTVSAALPRPPDPWLLRAAQNLEASQKRSGERPWLAHIEWAKKRRGINRPGEDTDVLWSSTARRRLHHPYDRERRTGEPRIFIGRIASANILLKHPARRDELRKLGFRAVEMEGAGVADAAFLNRKGFFVIRGISDYCDPHKNDEWQPYAAIAAAAYMRALLETIRGSIPAICDPDRARRDLFAGDPSKRTSAARCLGLLRFRPALAELEHQLANEVHPEACYWIALAIAYIGGADARMAIERFRQRSDYSSNAHTRLIIDDALRILQGSANPHDEGGIQ